MRFPAGRLCAWTRPAPATLSDNDIFIREIVANAVDATGCGDAFWGGFLSSLRIQGAEKAADLTEEMIRTAMNYGNVSGWICVQTKGGIPSLPTRAQIEAEL